MQKRNSIIGNTLLLSWSTLCISIFVYFPGRVSYIHWSNLRDLPIFTEKLGRLSATSYVVNLLLAFMGIVIFSLSCISLGSFLAKYIGIDSRAGLTTSLSGLAQFATKFLLGQGIFSLIFLTLGGMYKLTPLTIVIILVIGFLPGLYPLKKNFQDFFKQDNFDNRKDKTIFWLSIAILILTTLLTSARISYDATSIYFSDAKLTALSGHTLFFINDVFVASVFHSAIQFAAIIQVFGDQSARMFSWANGMVIIIFSLALGEIVGLSRRAGLILLTLLLTSTAFVDLLGDGKVDLFSTAPAIAAIYWMIAKSQNQGFGKSAFLLIGFFTGLAIIGRPFNAFLLGIFCILFYLQQTFISNRFKLSSVNAFIGSLFWIGIGATSLGIYHLFANWIILGNPLAFLSSVSNINPASGPWDFVPKQMLALRLFYPFAATFRNTPQSLGNISPLVIAFLPALLLSDIRKRVKISGELASLVVISVITIILWIFSFFTVVEIRYVFFLWIIIFLPIAEIIASVLKSEDPFFQNIVFGLLTTLLGFIAFRTVFIAIDSYSPLDRQGNPHCSTFILCDYLNSINKSASLGDRVLTLGAYRYYLRADLFSCSTTHKEYQLLQELSWKDVERFWLEVYRQGYKYIAYENEYTNRHLQFGIMPGPENTPQWVNLEPIYGKSGDPVIAYKINANNPPIVIEQECKQNRNNIWEVGAIK